MVNVGNHLEGGFVLGFEYWMHERSQIDLIERHSDFPLDFSSSPRAPLEPLEKHEQDVGTLDNRYLFSRVRSRVALWAFPAVNFLGLEPLPEVIVDASKFRED